MSTTSSTSDDEQHLKLIGIFHYVVGGLAALFACFPLLYVALGLAMVFAPQSMSGKSGDRPPAIVGWVFSCMGVGMFLFGLAAAACIMYAGRCISRRRRYWFVFILACIQCCFFPFGTALGVFTILVLSRPSVKTLFHLASPGTTT